jgi:hypothetical protein
MHQVLAGDIATDAARNSWELQVGDNARGGLCLNANCGATANGTRLVL